MTLKATPWWLEKKGENIYFLSCTIFWRKPCISRKMDWVFPCCCLSKHPAPSASCAGLCGCSSVTGFPSPATRSGSWPHCNHAGNQKKKDCSIFLWLASSLASAPSKFMPTFWFITSMLEEGHKRERLKSVVEDFVAKIKGSCRHDRDFSKERRRK